MSWKRDEELQRYHDGELPAGKARQVYRRVEQSPDDQARLEAMDEIGSMLQESCRANAEEANFDFLWTRVEAGIKDNEPVGAWERLLTWLRGNRLATASVFAGAAALAAAVVVSLSAGKPAPTRFDGIIEELEVGSDVVSTVITVEDPDGEGEMPVIWITDMDAEGDG